MKPEACLEVANKSRRQAEFYFKKGNVGRSFAHFLVALKLCPSWKIELSHQFVSALYVWGEKLDEQQRYKDLFNCYEQALEIFPDNEEVLNNLGSHLYRWGHTLKACNYFRQAVANNSGYLPAIRNLQGCCNLLVERWHYCMLNDSVRNDAYRAAITRRVLQHGAGMSVLDIGTGTGLLSLFAAEAGSEHVFACDYSPTMIEIATQVIKANGASSKVTLINKMSNNIVIPEDMPARVSLVVTETLDAGLLGEGILQTLIHAWEHLLVPSDPPDVVRVVPQAATVWIAPIECLHIARKYRVLETQFEDDGFDLRKLQLIAKRDEPYDTEDINMIPGGYRFLAKCCKALHMRFNDCEDMSKWLNGQKAAELWFECTEPGSVDALVAWFDINLDEIITLSSTPLSDCDADNFHEASCWDQAVFPVQHPIILKHKDKLKVTVSCLGGKISANVSDHEQSDVMNTLEQALYSSTISTHDNEMIGKLESDVKGEIDNKENKIMVTDSEGTLSKTEDVCGLVFDNTLKTFVSQEAVRFLNDSCWMETLQKTAEYLCEELKDRHMCSVLDLCPFPVLGLYLLKKRDVRVTCISSCPDDVIKRFSQLNGICTDRVQCLDEQHLSEFLQEYKYLFDVIVVHPVDQTGELKENILNILPVLRSLLADRGIMLPRHITVYGQLLESDWLKQVSHVQDNSNTCGFNIASFINIFQVPQHLDLNLSTLGATLVSSCSELLCLSLDTDSNDMTQTVTMHATCSGKANALAYWFDILIHEAVPTVSTFHLDSHVSQAAILFQPYISVSKLETVQLQVKYHQGFIYVQPLHSEDDI